MPVRPVRFAKNMRPAIGALLLAISLPLFVVIGGGCADREETPIALADSTLVYTALDPEGPTAKITLCRKFGSKTGKPIGAGQQFAIGEKSKVRARIEFERLPGNPPMELMFHLVWLQEEGKEFYTKRIDMAPGEIESSIETSISIKPGKREPGRYRLLVYLYRELIAEKSFTLLEDPDAPDDPSSLSPYPPGYRESS